MGGLELAAVHRRDAGADDFGDKRRGVERQAEKQRGEFRRQQAAAGKIESAEHRIVQLRWAPRSREWKRQAAVAEKYARQRIAAPSTGAGRLSVITAYQKNSCTTNGTLRISFDVASGEFRQQPIGRQPR